MFAHWQYRILALALALLTWYLVAGRDRVETWVEVPVELTGLPEDLFVREGLESAIKVRVRGPKSVIRGLDPRDMAYPVDLSRAAPGQVTVPLGVDLVRLSRSLEAVEVSPQNMTLSVERSLRKTVPVEPVWRGKIPDDLRLLNATSEPAEVLLKGPSKVLERLDRALTAPLVAGAGFEKSVSVEAPLALPPDVKASPAKVRVLLTFGARTKEVWLKAPVEVLPRSVTNVSVKPAVVQVLLSVPVNLLKNPDFKDSLSAVVLLEPGTPRGKRSMPYQLRLPPETTLVKALPEDVEVSVRD